MGHPVLLVHSGGPQGAGQGSAPFVARLRQELGAGYEVLFPMMPDPEEPSYARWSERLDQLLADAEEDVVIVGHSLGGSVALKHLAEAGGAGIAGLVLVAAPYWGDQGWAAQWALPEGWPTSSSELPPTFLFHSRDDEDVAFGDLERYAERLPGATARPLDGNGHLFDRGDLSEIVVAIRRLAEA